MKPHTLQAPRSPCELLQSQVILLSELFIISTKFVELPHSIKITHEIRTKLDHIILSPICAGDQYLDDEHGDDYQWAKWMKTAFEKVTAHVGRVYVVDTTKPEEVKDPRNVERCVGTVGLMDVHGESICALHCVYRAVEHKERYKIDVVYPNYHKGTLAFDAKPKTMDEDVDLCVLEPVTPLKKPNLPTTYLDLATDAREDDMVYCFFFPKDPLKHETPQVIRQLMRPEKALNVSRSNTARQPADSPTIISGTVCFSEWMQGVATYERLPDANGGVIVSRSGRVKGIHVKAFTCGELREKVHSENPEELRVAKKLCKKMNSYAPSEGIPVFVPPHGLVRLLGLEGGCELLQAAIRQNKVQMKVEKIKKPKTKSSTSRRPSTRPTRSTRSTRSRTSMRHYKCRAYKSRRSRKR